MQNDSFRQHTEKQFEYATQNWTTWTCEDNRYLAFPSRLLEGYPDFHNYITAKYWENPQLTVLELGGPGIAQSRAFYRLPDLYMGVTTLPINPNEGVTHIQANMFGTDVWDIAESILNEQGHHGLDIVVAHPIAPFHISSPAFTLYELADVFMTMLNKSYSLLKPGGIILTELPRFYPAEFRRHEIKKDVGLALLYEYLQKSLAHAGIENVFDTMPPYVSYPPGAMRIVKSENPLPELSLKTLVKAYRRRLFPQAKFVR